MGKRKFLGVRFDCCGIYHRIYENKEGTAYVGCCPKCRRNLRIRIGAKGTKNRFFIAS